MKKSLVIVILIFAAVSTAVLIIQLGLTDLSFANEAVVRFENGETNIVRTVNENDFTKIKRILNGKILYKDNPSCGFGENASVQFNQEQTFCFAQDTCPFVYWKEKNKYLRLSEQEQEELYSILYSYGFFFPCL